MRKHWFLPQRPDVMATLAEQAETTVAGAEAFLAWAGGDQAAQQRVRTHEHRAEELRRTLAGQLRRAFSTPVDQEDLFTLSERLGAVLTGLRNIVGVADGVAVAPDAPIAAMAEEILGGVRHLRAAIDGLTAPGDAATSGADDAAAAEHRMERIYRDAMRGLLEVSDLREVTSRGELYRRTLEIGERLKRVADRVWYAVVKES